jgi:FSR family fosmidomycin resistance protein-like MFS transporter
VKIFRDRRFILASLSHLAVDLLNGQRDLLLAFLSVPLGLSNTLIGLISTIYTLLGSLLQPIFGWISDRIGFRWVAGIGILWMALTFGVAVNVEGQLALPILLLAALGSAAFHPAGAKEATVRAKSFISGHETFAVSLFFLFGQSGLAIGPAIGGLLLEKWGSAGMTFLLLLAVPLGVSSTLYTVQQEEPSSSLQKCDFRDSISSLVLPSFLLFVALTGMRSWAQMSVMTFLPKYFTDLQYNPSLIGSLAALLMLGSAIGGVSGGWLADRFGKRVVLVATLIPAAVPLSLYPHFGPTGWAYLLTPLIGALLGSSHSILVVMAQNMLPNAVGAASGLILGFIFASGSVGALVSGVLADAYSFTAVFRTAAVAAFLAGLVSLVMRDLGSEANSSVDHSQSSLGPVATGAEGSETHSDQDPV